MSIWTISDDETYEQIRANARSRIAHDQERGGDSLAWAPIFERNLAEHVTAAERRGEPCGSCGETWPCSAIGHILSPD